MKGEAGDVVIPNGKPETPTESGPGAPPEKEADKFTCAVPAGEIEMLDGLAVIANVAAAVVELDDPAPPPQLHRRGHTIRKRLRLRRDLSAADLNGPTTIAQFTPK